MRIWMCFQSKFVQQGPDSSWRMCAGIVMMKQNLTVEFPSSSLFWRGMSSTSSPLKSHHNKLRWPFSVILESVSIVSLLLNPKNCGHDLIKVTFRSEPDRLRCFLWMPVFWLNFDFWIKLVDTSFISGSIGLRKIIYIRFHLSKTWQKKFSSLDQLLFLQRFWNPPCPPRVLLKPRFSVRIGNAIPTSWPISSMVTHRSCSTRFCTRDVFLISFCGGSSSSTVILKLHSFLLKAFNPIINDCSTWYGATHKLVVKLLWSE